MLPEPELANTVCTDAAVSPARPNRRMTESATTLVAPSGSSVVEGWQSHLDLVRRALARGFVQGRDSHGSQLPTRYAATYAHEAAAAARG